MEEEEEKEEEEKEEEKEEEEEGVTSLAGVCWPKSWGGNRWQHRQDEGEGRW